MPVWHSGRNIIKVPVFITLFKMPVWNIASSCWCQRKPGHCNGASRLLSWEHFASQAGNVSFEQEIQCCSWLGYRRLDAGPRNPDPQHQRSIITLAFPLATTCSWSRSSPPDLHLYNPIFPCLFRPAGNLAWNLTAADPWIRHAVFGDGWKVSVCVWSWWEGPASLSSAS